MVPGRQKYPRPLADAGLLLLEIRAASGNLGYPADLHAGELSGRPAGPAREETRHDGRALAATAREQGLRADQIDRSVPAAGDPAALSHRRDRPPRAGRSNAAGARDPDVEAARAVLRL